MIKAIFRFLNMSATNQAIQPQKMVRGLKVEGLYYVYEPRYEKTRFFAYAKTKTQISFAVTAKLISGFVFRYIDSTTPLLSKSKISSL